MADSEGSTGDPPPWRRTVIVFTLAGLYAMGSYLLLQSSLGEGLISATFLLAQPTALSVFICIAIDPKAQRTRQDYVMVPISTTIGAIFMGAFFFHEGVICIIMLSPLWLVLGLLGSWIAWRIRRRDDDLDGIFCAGFLALPMVTFAVEQQIDLPWQAYEVSRTVEIAAAPERIWPLLEGIPDVRPDEGRWNISQDVLGVPRPLGARLSGEREGAVRSAQWQRGIAFDEVITRYDRLREIGWRFDFSKSHGWEFTDPHLRPDSGTMRIETGGYRVVQVNPSRTRVTLWTRYAARTPVNPYAALWGQFFLGDMENNLLATVRQRAEAARKP